MGAHSGATGDGGRPPPDAVEGRGERDQHEPPDVGPGGLGRPGDPGPRPLQLHFDDMHIAAIPLAERSLHFGNATTPEDSTAACRYLRILARRGDSIAPPGYSTD